jgi:hypothetical protein
MSSSAVEYGFWSQGAPIAACLACQRSGGGMLASGKRATSGKVVLASSGYMNQGFTS